MAAYYPPVSFCFGVAIAGSSTPQDAAFSEVAGLEAERPAFEIKEGGENRFVHRLPDRARFGNLTLKRGVMLWQSDLSDWCSAVLESDFGEPLETRDIDVVLLDAARAPLMAWCFQRAWPVKWSVSPLSAEKGELAIDTLELAYAHFTRQAMPLGGAYLKPDE